jgi:hypothetical protein
MGILPALLTAIGRLVNLDETMNDANGNVLGMATKLSWAPTIAAALAAEVLGGRCSSKRQRGRGRIL